MCELVCSTIFTFCGLIRVCESLEVNSFPSGVSPVSLHLGDFISWTDIHDDRDKR